MASPVAHGLAAYAAMVTIEPSLTADRTKIVKTMIASVVIGTLADADFLIAPFTENRVWQHHFFSHSIPFTVLFFFLTWAIAKVFHRKDAFKISLLIGAAYGSHILLDYFTEDGSKPFGIPLFWPFTDHHFQAPIEIFRSVYRGDLPILFGTRNLITIIREFAIVGPIALLAHLHAASKAFFKSTETRNIQKE